MGETRETYTIRRLRELQQECREELQPINAERLEIYNTSIRPMYLKYGVIEYGEFPPEIKAHLAHLDERATKIIHKYEKMASAQTQVPGTPTND